MFCWSMLKQRAIINTRQISKCETILKLPGDAKLLRGDMLKSVANVSYFTKLINT